MKRIPLTLFVLLLLLFLSDVAVGSGGVWKAEDAGTTWTPIIDGQPSYSIGCITPIRPPSRRSGSAPART